MKQITVKIEKNYLIFPISAFVGSRTVMVEKNGKLIDDFKLRLDYVNPEHMTYYDVSALRGEEITIRIAQDVTPIVEQTDTPAPLIFERPYLHFTPTYGWLNDPNGLVSYTSPVTGETTYHLFYQYNPYDYVWGNMHWGHAVSRDLFHWEHRPIALAPDENGTMFSGSAIVDYDNRTGLKCGDEDVILLFYTCAGNDSVRSRGRKFTQCLAYSTDGGQTFTKYAQNPVVDNIIGSNRDPKVVWCAELGRYVMALYLEKNIYALLTSSDLLHWTELQRLPIDGDRECPDLYPLTTRGSDKRKWVMSGASHHYIVGEFENGLFVPDGKGKVLSYGDSSYAAQTYSRPTETRRTQLAWNRFVTFPNAPLCGQMSMPYDLSLCEDKGEYYLEARPVAELEALVTDTAVYEQIELTDERSFVLPLQKSAYRIVLTYDQRRAADIEIGLFGRRITLENARNTLLIHKKTMPLCMEGNEVTLTLIVDRGSLEVFSCNGRAILTEPLLCDFNIKQFSLRASDTTITSCTVQKLSL